MMDYREVVVHLCSERADHVYSEQTSEGKKSSLANEEVGRMADAEEHGVLSLLMDRRRPW